MKQKLLTIFCLGLMIIVWMLVLFLPDNRIRVIACDVGQGDSLLIIQGATQVLIDGGPNNNVLSCLGKYMPWWDKTLELVALTHPHADHYVGLIEVTKRFTVQDFFISNTESTTVGYRLLKNELGSRGVTVTSLNSNVSFTFGSIVFEIINPPANFDSGDVNEYSLVFLLTYGNFRALLTGDISPYQTLKMLSSFRIPQVDYLKVPHHGSRNGLSTQLLDAVQPQVAVISSGKDNRFGHPHAEVIEILKRYKIKTLNTQDLGDIEVISDGINMSVTP